MIMIKKNIILLYVMGISLAVLLSPLLTGMEKIDKDKILETDAEWDNIYMNYPVEAAFMDPIKDKIGKGLKIDVYLGLWCTDSKNNVPVFIKIIDEVELGNLPVEVNYYTVERKPNKEVKYYVEDLKVERVPTFIFYRDGKEIGRIVENPIRSMIEDFLGIIF